MPRSLPSTLVPITHAEPLAPTPMSCAAPGSCRQVWAVEADAKRNIVRPASNARTLHIIGFLRMAGLRGFARVDVTTGRAEKHPDRSPAGMGPKSRRLSLVELVHHRVQRRVRECRKRLVQQ